MLVCYLGAGLVTLWEEDLGDDDVPRGEGLCLAVHHDGPVWRLRAGRGEVGGGRQDVLQFLYPVHPEREVDDKLFWGHEATQLPVEVPISEDLIHHLHWLCQADGATS